jgi:hypothetical protein
MDIKKIDDAPFRKETVKAFHWHDSSRRFELHFTDIITCLLCSVKRKILPENGIDPNESYGQILSFVRGLGFDNLITERISGKTTVWIDGMQGNIDMIFHQIPYELTSSIYVGNSVKNSDDLAGKYRYKIEQLKAYMAGLGSTIGRLKLIEVASRPPSEFTWELSLSPLELAHLRIDLIRRKDLLTEALATGNIQKLFELREMVTPILKDSFCLDHQTGYCKEWPLFQGKKWYDFQRAHKEWLSQLSDTKTLPKYGWVREPTPIMKELQKWMQP